MMGNRLILSARLIKIQFLKIAGDFHTFALQTRYTSKFIPTGMARLRNQKLFDQLRKQNPVFTYTGYGITVDEGNLVLEFSFNINDKFFFRPRSVIRTGLLIGDLAGKIEKIRPLVSNLAFQIGMIELISYWKASCSPELRILPANLTPEQVIWWKKLYFHGLGEFFYLNSIEPDFESFVDIRPAGATFFEAVTVDLEDKFLVPIGGGKDSAVTLSLLMNQGESILPLIMNPRGATIETIKAAGLEMNQVIVIERTIDPLLITMNNMEFLNGHTPFSAMLAFYSLMCSAITGYGNIALSNESSANESTIPGTMINHQYSKSVGFERDFREYYKSGISDDFNYFSFLRPLSELQIAKIFSSLKVYHDVFRSCNAGSKTDSWCGKCPKCLFTHIMLSAFLGIREADRIIGRPMLDDAELQQTFNELAGYSEIKPFECVGTTLEVKQALRMIARRMNDEPLPFLLRAFIQKGDEIYDEPDFQVMEEPHFVREKLVEILKLHLL